MPEEQSDANIQPNTPAPPGAVISPGPTSASDTPPSPTVSPPAPLAPEPQVQVNVPQETVSPPPVISTASPQTTESGQEEQTGVPDTLNEGGLYNQPSLEPDILNESVSWTASEFIAHEKSRSWYLGLAVVTVVFASAIYLLTKDIISVVVIIVAALIFGITGSNKPRELQYRLDRSGLTIGAKHYIYEEYKSFSVITEGAFSSINFMPLKRFAPLISIYYHPEDEKKIMSVLSAYLPYEAPRRDAVDSLMRKIRF
jgi:hypothetical protein